MRQSRSDRRSPRLALIAAVFMAAGGLSGNAQAQFAVIDATQIANALKEYAEEAKRWQEQIKQYQSTLGNATMMLKAPSFNMELTMQLRPANQGVAERCPDPSGSGGGLLGSMFDMFKPDLTGDIYKQQQLVCTNIVLLENKKYNELVTLVQEADKRKADIDKGIAEVAKAGATEGEMKSASIRAQSQMATSLAEMQYSLARIQAFDGMIESLKIDQQTLARQALSGSQNNFSASGLLGKVVQGATLEVALQAARARER